MVVWPFARWTLVTKLAGPLDRARHRAGEADIDVREMGADPRGEAEAASLIMTGVGEHQINLPSALEQKLLRFVGIRRLDYPEAALAQILGERMTDENAGFDEKEDRGVAGAHRVLTPRLSATRAMTRPTS